MWFPRFLNPRWPSFILSLLLLFFLFSFLIITPRKCTQPFPIWRAGAYKKVVQEIFDTINIWKSDIGTGWWRILKNERSSYRQNFFQAFFFATEKVGSKTAMIFFHWEDIFLPRAQFTQRNCIPNIPAVFRKLRDAWFRNASRKVTLTVTASATRALPPPRRFQGRCILCVVRH